MRATYSASARASPRHDQPVAITPATAIAWMSQNSLPAMRRHALRRRPCDDMFMAPKMRRLRRGRRQDRVIAWSRDALFRGPSAERLARRHRRRSGPIGPWLAFWLRGGRLALRLGGDDLGADLLLFGHQSSSLLSSPAASMKRRRGPCAAWSKPSSRTSLMWRSTAA